MCYSLANLYSYFPHSCRAQEKAVLQGYNPSQVKRGDVPMVTLRREAEQFEAQCFIWRAAPKEYLLFYCVGS